MATAKERIQEPDYKELSSLVLGGTEELKKWREKEVNRQRSKVGGSVSKASFNKYEETLDILVAQIIAGHKFYETKVSKWDKTPLTWAKFPDTHKEYRQLVYALENQKMLVEAEKKRMAREKAAKDRPAPRPSTRATTPKKSGWLKIAALVGMVGIGGFWWGSKQNNSNQSQAGDRSGNTISAVQQTSLDQLRYRYAEAGLEAGVEEQERRGLIARLGKSVDKAEAEAEIASANRAKNYHQQREKVDTAESWEDTSRAVSRTTTHVKDTLKEANGVFNNLRNVFKTK